MNHVVVRLLKDGSGRVRICWLAPDPNGPIMTQQRVEMTARGPLSFGGVTGRIACQPARKDLAPQNGVLCMHSGDPRAATCPECMNTDAYRAAMAVYEEMLETATQS